MHVRIKIQHNSAIHSYIFVNVKQISVCNVHKLYDGLTQDCDVSIANAQEVEQSWTNALMKRRFVL